MCGKRSYNSRSAAAEVLRRLQERKASGTIQDMCYAKRAYFCDSCDGWHLTKQDLRRRSIPSDVLSGDY